MQNDKICSDIVGALVMTRVEANILLTELDVLMRSLYIVGPGDFNESLENNVRAKTALAISQFANDKNREEILKMLKDKLNSLDYFGLTIAFEPNMAAVRKIHSWIKNNIGDQIALDITIDKSILGGAIFEYKGRVAKFVLLSRVEEYFLTNNVNI